MRSEADAPITLLPTHQSSTIRLVGASLVRTSRAGAGEIFGRVLFAPPMPRDAASGSGASTWTLR